jgi:4-amino-4-deoxy-L-arabinose transferase-like glycosyltransferase
MVVCRWARELYGRWAGVGASGLMACCPNVIAHAGLATLDVGAAATTLLALYCFWRWAREPGWCSCLASAVALGVAALCKLSAVFFLPVLLVVFLAVARPRLRVVEILGFAAVSFLTLWAGYGFQVGTIVPPGHAFYSPYGMGDSHSAPNLLLRAVGYVRLPAYRFWHGIIELLSHNLAGHRTYLLGERSNGGWWYYFPVALAVKTTIPFLLLVGWGLLRRRPGTLYPLAAAAVILGVSMASHLNLGVRYVLVLYPLFAILASVAFIEHGRKWLRAAALALALWHAGESFLAHPDYLAYFNEIARGREEQFLLDSNLDWGQDLARLGRYLQERGIEEVHLSYFGVTSPAKMGIRSQPLRPQEQVNGWVAVSGNNLLGLYNDPGEFAWLRERKPEARIGKSIWLYRVP